MKLVGDNSASRRHAVIAPAGEAHAIRDLQSRRGTFLNRQRLEEAELPLAPGDKIEIGSHTLQYVSTAPDPRVGKTIGGFRLLERVGNGAMGVVYKASQPGLDRIVALKILSPSLKEHPELVAWFIKEARFMAKASHPHVVQVHTVGQDEGLHYIAMEYMAGGSLRGLIQKEGKLSPQRALPLILDAASALVWAGEQGVIHRDLKPANLLLDESGRVKVGDFGLAADSGRLKQTAAGDPVVGTSHFMAPEQALRKAIDQRADIYALGCTLYAALAGEAPYVGLTGPEIRIKKQREDPLPLSARIRDVPPALEALVSKMMARDPDDRHQSAQELHRELTRVSALLAPGAGRAPAAPRGLTVKQRALRRPPTQRRHVPDYLVTLLIVLVCAAGLAWWFLGRESASHQTNDSKPSKTSTASSPGAATGRTPSVLEPLPARPQQPQEPQPELPVEAPRLASHEVEIEGLLLEGDFSGAIARLEALRKSPALKTFADDQLQRVRSAEVLHGAREKALLLEGARKYREAKEELEKVLGSLDGVYRGEAKQAIDHLERRMAQSEGVHDAGTKDDGP